MLIFLGVSFNQIVVFSNDCAMPYANFSDRYEIFKINYTSVTEETNYAMLSDNLTILGATASLGDMLLILGISIFLAYALENGFKGSPQTEEL